MKRIVFACLLVAGCGPEPDTVMKTSSPTAMVSDRFEVERVGVFKDEIAYSNKRGIYVIRDTKTGKEYVGVSGVGISELGSHQQGKVHVGDER